MTIENNADIIKQSSFRELLTNLSNIESPSPLRPEDINVSELKNTLINSGIRLDLIENNPELKASIQESQFRSFDTGRGPAMVAAFGSSENLQKYFDWAAQVSVDQPSLSKGDESSKSRGLIQFAADTVALATGNQSLETYCRKCNWRVGKKYQKDADLPAKFYLPTDEVGLKKLKETSSIPKGSASKAFEIILSLNK